MPRTIKRTMRIARAAQIRALAAPVRQDLVDCLQASGACSVARLARLLGRPADSLYYHLRRLEALGLVVRLGRRTHGGPGARFELPAWRPRLEYRPEDPRNVEAVSRVVGAMLRSASRGFRRAFASDVAVVRGASRNLWAGRTIGWLSDEELRRVNVLLIRLAELIRRRRGGGAGGRRLHEFTYVLAPVSPRGRRRGTRGTSKR